MPRTAAPDPSTDRSRADRAFDPPAPDAARNDPDGDTDVRFGEEGTYGSESTHGWGGLGEDDFGVRGPAALTDDRDSAPSENDPDEDDPVQVTEETETTEADDHEVAPSKKVNPSPATG